MSGTSVVELRASGGSGFRAQWPRVIADAVRSEFRDPIIYGRPGDPVLYGQQCLVPDCPRPKRGAKGLCFAHNRQRRRRGGDRPTAEWLKLAPAAGGPLGLLALKAPVPCGVLACTRSVWLGVMCAGHGQSWARTQGKPDLELYCATAPGGLGKRVTHPPGSCAVAGCRFSRMPSFLLCDGHERRFRVLQRKDDSNLDAFLEWLAHPGLPVFDFRGLAEPLASELRFGLQCRSDQRTTRLRDDIFAGIVRGLRRDGYRSLLDAMPYVRSWAPEQGIPFLRFVDDQLDRLGDAHRGLEEWDRDEWRLSRLPIPVGDVRGVISFEFCDEDWLRELIKRWLRWRIASGISASTALWNTRGLRVFVEFCQRTGRPLRRPGDITRRLLEDWHAETLSLPVTVGTRARWLGALRVFLDDVRRHEWAPGLPSSAAYHRREIPRRDEILPRFIEEPVIQVLERDESLARLPDLTTRTLVLILIETGLRSVDARPLELDSVSTDATGAAYLRYFNHKLSRERHLPISSRLAQQIARQQTWVRERFPTPGACLLPRPRRNPDGRYPYTYGALIGRLRVWARELGLRDANGAPVAVTPHRFRHTLATRMINAGVPQVAVQQMLDHDSPRMTHVYARLHDSTLRAEFDRYQERVNIAGEVVTFDPDGPIADAAWAAQNISRAKQTLPNGLCGLPLQQTCPHPNACLTCPSFLTTAEFLPVHREQLTRTRQLIADARERGQQRLVEMNEPVELNLIRIIESLETLPQPEQEHADAA